ncbi:hypothetical protein ACSNOK_12105 [Streptomyces sp. URMC 126]|uniref:hypothetical protein n=1 Tax=Streptomyces sp. URMC 126 TaxID=3423401 RepID=UPI003F1B01AC
MSPAGPHPSSGPVPWSASFAIPAPASAHRLDGSHGREPSGTGRPGGQPIRRPGDGAAETVAADLLAGLRRYDPRLLLSVDDVRELVPAVQAWLDRGVEAVHVTRALTADLPVGRIARPVALLRHRLLRGLPPALPADEPRPAPVAAPKPLPLQTCDGCERAFRAARPGLLCRDCRERAAVVAAG